MVEGPAPGRDSVIAIDEQDRENVVADGLKTSHADEGNRRGNKSVFLGAFPNEINSLGRRFVSHQPPQRSALSIKHLRVLDCIWSVQMGPAWRGSSAQGAGPQVAHVQGGRIGMDAPTR